MKSHRPAMPRRRAHASAAYASVAIALALALGGTAAPAFALPTLQEVLTAAGAGDYAKAARLARELAESGDASAQYTYALMLLAGKGVAADDRAGVEWLTKAAVGNLAQAQMDLAQLYLDGTHGVLKDPRQGLDWYRRAAEKGNNKAQLVAGVMLLRGTAGDADPKGGMRLIAKASEGGEGTAQAILGRMLAEGAVLPKDPVAAATWYLRSARQGTPGGALNLANAYEKGIGVAVDPVRAAAWFLVAERVAPAADKPQANERWNALSAGFTDDQRAQARRLAAAWHPLADLPRDGEHVPMKPGRWEFVLVTPPIGDAKESSRRIERCVAESDLGDVSMLLPLRPELCSIAGRTTRQGDLDWQATCGFETPYVTEGRTHVDAEHGSGSLRITQPAMEGMPQLRIETKRLGECEAGQ